MKSVGIDIGTTTINGVVLDLENGEVVYKETISSDSFIDTSNHWEKIQDVDTIITKATALLDRCLQQQDIVAIGLTGQMHGIVYVDSKGVAVSPLYTWQDGRGQVLVEKFNTFTKHPIASGYGLVTHAYQQQNGLVNQTASKICTIMDYFGMVLTKRQTPLMHVSNGASLGFWDLEKSQFDKDALSKAEIDKKILPEITNEIEILGYYKNIPVLVALGDNQASFLGTVGNKNDTVLVNMGTGGQVSLLVNDYVFVSGIETRPFINGKYLLVGASLCGGRAYAILERFLRNYVKEATGIDESQYSIMEKLASRVEMTSLSVCTTFNGTRLDSTQLGSISNMSEDNFIPEQLVYGFMQGMVSELLMMYRLMNVSGMTHLMASGNGIRKNKVLKQMVEELFALPLTLASYEEEAACGAALSYINIRK